MESMKNLPYSNEFQHLCGHRRKYSSFQTYIIAMSSKIRPQRPHIIPPGSLTPSTASKKYTNKDLPPIPKDDHQKRVASSSSREHIANQIRTPTPVYEMSAESYRPDSEPKPDALSPESTSVLPMTKSSHKILQLTGFDPRFEKTFPKDHQQAPVSPVSTASSGSVYSQAEDSPNTPTYESDNFSRFDSWGSKEPGPPTQPKEKMGEIYLKAESYSSGEKDASSISSLASSRKERPLPTSKRSQDSVASQRREGSPSVSQPQEPVAFQRRERPIASQRPQEPLPHQKREKVPPLNNPLGLAGIMGPVDPQRKARQPRKQFQEPVAPQQRPPMNKSEEPAESYRYRDRSPKALKNGRVLPLLHTPDVNMEDMTTLRELLEEEQWKNASGTADLYSQYHRQFTELELDAPVPKPLTLRNTNVKIRTPKRVSILSNVRESFAAGVNEITSPTSGKKHFSSPDWQATSPAKSKHPNTPIKPRARFALDDSDESPHETVLPLKLKRSIFGTGKHPLKSPFPFSNFIDTSESDDAETTSPKAKPQGKRFSKRLSGAIKRATSTHFPPIKKMSMIKNGERDASGPDTPLPTTPGFNMQEVYSNARKTLNIKTADEKKRESLRKKIVVVGLTDQGPDGRLSEWV